MDSEEDVLIDPKCLKTSKIHPTIILMGFNLWKTTQHKKSQKKRSWQAVVEVEGTRYVMDIRNDGDGVDRVLHFRKAHMQ